MPPAVDGWTWGRGPAPTGGVLYAVRTADKVEVSFAGDDLMVDSWRGTATMVPRAILLPLIIDAQRRGVL